MADRQYRAGHRRRDFHYGNRQFSESRYGWVRTYLGQFVILVDKADDDGDLNVTLYHPKEKARPVALNLTDCTEEELIAMKDLFDKAFELAIDTARRRDKVAEDAFQRGDDRYARSYREVPQLVYRQGALDAHREGVRERHEPVSLGGWGGLPADDAGVRGPGNGVAEQHEDRGAPEDDGPETD